MKLQNLTSYSTNLKFLHIIAIVYLTHVSDITLNHLDPIVEKEDGVLHKKTDEFFALLNFPFLMYQF